MWAESHAQKRLPLINSTCDLRPFVEIFIHFCFGLCLFPVPTSRACPASRYILPGRSCEVQAAGRQPVFLAAVFPTWGNSVRKKTDRRFLHRRKRSKVRGVPPAGPQEEWGHWGSPGHRPPGPHLPQKQWICSFLAILWAQLMRAVQKQCWAGDCKPLSYFCKHFRILFDSGEVKRPQQGPRLNLPPVRQNGVLEEYLISIKTQ